VGRRRPCAGQCPSKQPRPFKFKTKIAPILSVADCLGRGFLMVQSEALVIFAWPFNQYCFLFIVQQNPDTPVAFMTVIGILIKIMLLDLALTIFKRD